MLNRLQSYYMLIISIALSGCGTMQAQMQSLAAPGSKYQPAFVSSSDVDNYIEVISKVNNKVVTDERGSYHHSLSDEKLQRVLFNNTDDGALRQLLSGATGLLAPIYVYANTRNGPYMAPAWSATERRHAYLTKDLHLKLLPLEATRKYHAAFEATRMEKRTAYSFQSLTESMKAAGLQAGYIVTSGLDEDYYTNLPTFKHGLDLSDSIDSYMYASKRITTNGSIVSFLPTALASAMNGGAVYMKSECLLLDLREYKVTISELTTRSILPVKVTFVDERGRSMEPQQLMRAKERFSAIVPTQAIRGIAVERGCRQGLSALGVAGSVSSTRLD